MCDTPLLTAEHAHQTLTVIVPLCVAALLFIVAAVLVTIILARKRRRSKTVFSDILFQENPYLSQDYIKKERLLPPDPMEFPRARLHLLNRVLGKQLFGGVDVSLFLCFGCWCRVLLLSPLYVVIVVVALCCCS